MVKYFNYNSFAMNPGEYMILVFAEPVVVIGVLGIWFFGLTIHSMLPESLDASLV